MVFSFFPPHCYDQMKHFGSQDGSLPFARSIKDIHSEFRLLSKLTQLLMTEGEKEEALQYATLAVQIANQTGRNLPFIYIYCLY